MKYVHTAKFILHNIQMANIVLENLPIIVADVSGVMHDYFAHLFYFTRRKSTFLKEPKSQI